MEYIRLAFFLSLWGLFFYSNWGEENLSVYLFVCALSVMIFFLSPLMKKKYIFPYVQMIILIIVYFVTSSEVFLYLLLYVLLIALPYMSIRVYSVQIAVFTLVCLLSLFLNDQLTVGWCLSIVAITLMALFYKREVEENQQRKDMYANLLQEYRVQKRQVFRTSHQVRLDERTRIAREIHDSVGHKLTALLMQLKMKVMQGDESYQNLLELAEDSLQETRYAVKELQSASLHGIESVLQLIRKLESESRITVGFTTENGVLSAQLTNEQSVALYRMLQEALTNAMKHADSREVKVILNKTATEDIEFRVHNKVKNQKPIRYGFGLENMQKRVQELGGKLRVYYAETDYVIRGSFPIERK